MASFYVLPSFYAGHRCCGDLCERGTITEPCWGDVKVIDEDYDADWWVWIHGCQGHNDAFHNVYNKSTRAEDNGATPEIYNEAKDCG